MNRGSKVDWNASRSYAIDAAEKNWVAKAVERRAELEAQGLIDSGCRFATFDITHECANRDGHMRPWSACIHEAVAQMREAQQEERERAQSHEAEQAVHPSGGGPEYRWTQR